MRIDARHQMIQNKTQYEVTKIRLESLTMALKELQNVRPTSVEHDEIIAIQVSALESQARTLKDQIAEWEAYVKKRDRNANFEIIALWVVVIVVYFMGDGNASLGVALCALALMGVNWFMRRR